MLRFIRFTLLAACLLAVAPSFSHAGPSRMSYQGVLTDGAGNLVPDGNYNLTFRIYDAPAAGTLYWTEGFAAVPVVKGGFSVVLGSTTPIDAPFESFVTYYLGVQVGANPELTPRVQLSGSPSAMSLGMTGDNGVLAGEIGWFASTSGLGAGGGYIHLANLATFSTELNLEPDFSGNGLYAYLAGYGSYLQWDGDGGGVPGSLTITGNSTTYFNTAALGDAAVSLPADAVSSSEILDEPGITSNHASTFFVIPSTSSAALSDIISVSITTPGPGYVVVSGDFQGNFLSAPARQIGFQISETSGAPLDGSYYFYAGLASASLGGWMPCAVHRTYFKAAGTYIFYMQAYNAGGGSGAAAFNPTITTHYFPTAYGPVTTIANAAEAVSFERSTPVAVSSEGGQPAGGGFQVDLRELELRVRREEARLAEAQKQLQVARMKEQQDASAKARAARTGAVGTVAPAPKEER